MFERGGGVQPLITNFSSFNPEMGRGLQPSPPPQKKAKILIRFSYQGGGGGYNLSMRLSAPYNRRHMS